MNSFLLDEIGCEIFTMDSSYLKDVPPSGESGDDLANVYLSVDILSILEIKEVDQFISLQVRLWMTWKDSRLTMLNLKTDEDLNTLTTLVQRANLDTRGHILQHPREISIS